MNLMLDLRCCKAKWDRILRRIRSEKLMAAALKLRLEEMRGIAHAMEIDRLHREGVL